MTLFVSALSLWLIVGNWMFYYLGPKDAEGIYTWSLPAAIGTIAVVCGLKFKWHFAVHGQAVLSVFLAAAWLISASWIA